MVPPQTDTGRALENLLIGFQSRRAPALPMQCHSHGQLLLTLWN